MSDRRPPRPTYYDLLRHPAWQQKRLRIMERAGFECEDCGATDKTLNVHHSYYEKGLNPWEYPDASLHCLCEDCHKVAQDRLTLLHRMLGRIGVFDVDRLIGYAMGLESESAPMVPLDVFSYEAALGIGQVWGLTPETVLAALVDGRIDGYRLHELKTGTSLQ